MPVEVWPMFSAWDYRLNQPSGAFVVHPSASFFGFFRGRDNQTVPNTTKPCFENPVGFGVLWCTLVQFGVLWLLSAPKTRVCSLPSNSSLQSFAVRCS